jgi:hypothetical protein
MTGEQASRTGVDRRVCSDHSARRIAIDIARLPELLGKAESD